MKFIKVDSARKLKIDEPVLVMHGTGVINWGKLVKEEKTVKGIERTFEIATFEEKNPTVSTSITHVAIP